ncbi:hypothetical protein C2G38_2040275 [Gigaspora rosea]|uniref:Uncharacterized protein n=1 Tax=Gigaspora rosea TaxID=44941 RepID=A0A397V001_9GLOM|nr:hypothetical protein C2G38_2040275 [Gigaspora rosea]
MVLDHIEIIKPKSEQKYLTEFIKQIKQILQDPEQFEIRDTKLDNINDQYYLIVDINDPYPPEPLNLHTFIVAEHNEIRLKESQQKNIESILSDKYRIVFNGKASLHQNNQTTVTIKFPGPLVDDKCQIYGCLVKKNEFENWETIPNVIIRFLAEIKKLRKFLEKIDANFELLINRLDNKSPLEPLISEEKILSKIYSSEII